MKNNTFYTSDRWYLTIYETKEKAEEAKKRWSEPGMTCSIVASVAQSPKISTRNEEMDMATTNAITYSHLLGSKVFFSKPGELILLIKKEEQYCNVVIEEKIGWIVMNDFLNLKEFINE